MILFVWLISGLGSPDILLELGYADLVDESLGKLGLIEFTIDTLFTEELFMGSALGNGTVLDYKDLVGCKDLL